ncbi:MAG: DUF1624 domain-containing protein [Candidatus Aenigmarchaeota archaeon]|nr:DUF1624 domain-containing protein [Candidatus Aenigmarchaeota archaeon]
MPKRFRELDFARGLAVILMIIFNYAFALRYFGVYNFSAGEIFWFWFPRFVGTLFITIAGISLAVSYGRKKKNFHHRGEMRGMKIFLLGMAITLVTWIFVPGQTVWFGILHLIGISVVISPFFLRFGKWNILLGLAFIAAGIYLSSFSFDSPWLLWLGLQPHNFATLDYFPMLPWFGFFLIGITFSGALYKNGKRNFRVSETKNPFLSFVAFLGRNSLAIYMIHIPSLLAVLAIAGFQLF